MISVVLVTYNSMKVLPACMEALEHSSSAQELEIILVDNASTDGTSNWISGYANRKADLPFREVHALTLIENHGYAYANNRGLEIAQGEMLLLLNPDTVVSREAITTCEEVLRENEKIGVVGCRLELTTGQLDKACKRSFPTLWNSFSRFSGLSMIFPKSSWLAGYNLTFLDEYGGYLVDAVCGAFLFARRDVYQCVGGLDEDFFMYGEDLDWCYRINDAGYLVWYEGSVTTVHVKGGNGGKRSRQSLLHFYNAMYLYYIKTRRLKETLITARALRCLVRLIFRVHVWLRSVALALSNLNTLDNMC